MQRLEIEDNIYRLRKERNITQDDLSKILQVSVSAVSKWESGVSYPDITLLPSIANFFNVSIDEIMNHGVDITDKEIDSITEDCSKEFENEGLEKGLDLCFKYTKKYVKAYKLKYMLGTISNIKASMSSDVEKAKQIYGKSLIMFEDIINNSNDDDLVESAIMMAGSTYVSFEEYDKAISLYSKMKSTKLNSSGLIVSVYLKQGKIDEAKRISTEALVYGMSNINLALANLVEIYKTEDEEIAKKYAELRRGIVLQLEGSKEDYSYYGELASINIANNKNEEALENIKHMLSVIKENSKKESTELWYAKNMIDNERKKESKFLGKLINEEKISSLLVKNLIKDERFEPLWEMDEFKKLIENYS